MNGTLLTPKPYAFIQARLGSTRLPGKVLLDLPENSGVTILDHIFNRLIRILPKEQIVFLIPETDSELENFLKQRNYHWFAGSETNVRERYILAAEKFNAKDIIRLTGDNPFVDVHSVELLMEAMYHLKTRMYCLSFLGLPLGMGVECFSYEALVNEKNTKTETRHTEHVSLHIKEDLETYSVFRLIPPHLTKEEMEFSNRIRMTIDESSDLKLANLVWQELGDISSFFGSKEVIQLYQKKPVLFSENEFVEQIRFTLPKNESEKKEIYIQYGDPKQFGSGHFDRCQSLSIELQMDGYAVNMDTKSMLAADISILDARETIPKDEATFLIDNLEYKNRKNPYVFLLPHPEMEWKNKNYFSFYTSPLIDTYRDAESISGNWFAYVGSLKEGDCDSLDRYLVDILSPTWKMNNIIRVGGTKPKTPLIQYYPRLTKMNYLKHISEAEGFISYFGQSVLEAVYLKKKVAVFGMTEIHKELGMFLSQKIEIPYLGEPNDWIHPPDTCLSSQLTLERNAQNTILNWLKTL